MIIKDMLSERNSRICYDKHFSVQKGNEFRHRGRIVEGVSLYFIYQYYVYLSNQNKEIEVLFPENGNVQPECFYRCSYDRQNGYKMKLDTKRLEEYIYSSVSYKPAKEASILYSDSNTTESISFYEAIRLLKENPEAFDYYNNKTTQSCLSYSMERVC